jgi:hypothetical protein
MNANRTQIGGNHYRTEIQHWDYVVANDLDYFQGQITKYITRWRKKNGVSDLYKARHFLDKYVEVILAAAAVKEANRVEPIPVNLPQAGEEPTAHGYVNQD